MKELRNPKGAWSRAAVPSQPLIRMPTWRFSRHVQLVGDPGADPELAEGTA